VSAGGRPAWLGPAPPARGLDCAAMVSKPARLGGEGSGAVNVSPAAADKLRALAGYLTETQGKRCNNGSPATTRAPPARQHDQIIDGRPFGTNWRPMPSRGRPRICRRKHCRRRRARKGCPKAGSLFGRGISFPAAWRRGSHQFWAFKFPAGDYWKSWRGRRCWPGACDWPSRRRQTLTVHRGVGPGWIHQSGHPCRPAVCIS